jgi:hypothetical protein
VITQKLGARVRNDAHDNLKMSNQDSKIQAETQEEISQMEEPIPNYELTGYSYKLLMHCG